MKKTKKILCLIIAAAAAFSMSVVASAESNINVNSSQTEPSFMCILKAEDMWNGLRYG